MAYDAADGEVVLFGGLDHGGALLNATWLWDGSTWTPRSPPPPPGLASGAMADDLTRGQSVLWAAASTWTWDGTDWTSQNSAHEPSQRQDVGMADDQARGQVVLFGGVNAGGTIHYADTWTW